MESLDSLEHQNKVNEIAERVFEIGKLDKVKIGDLFNCGEASISDSEVTSIKDFFKKSARVLVEEALVSALSKCSESENSYQCVEDFLKNQHSGHKYHDIAHSAISYEENKTLKPNFINADSYINNEILIREELHAALWFGQFGELSSFLALMDHKSFENWRKALSGAKQKALDLGYKPEELYVDKILMAVSEVAFDCFNSVFDNYQKFILLILEPASGSDAVTIKNWETLKDRILKSPDTRFKERAERIFDRYKTNKRILLDEFLLAIKSECVNTSII